MLVVAIIPGFEREEIDVAILGPGLHIAAEDEATGEHASRRRLINERTTIPANIDIDAVRAICNDDVLEICLPSPADSEDAHHVALE